MESESHEEAGDEEVESGAAGNESDMDLDLLAESESDSEESQVRKLFVPTTIVLFFNLKRSSVLIKRNFCITVYSN